MWFDLIVKRFDEFDYNPEEVQTSLVDETLKLF